MFIYAIISLKGGRAQRNNIQNPVKQLKMEFLAKIVYSLIYLSRIHFE